MTTEPTPSATSPARVEEALERVLVRMEGARPFAKPRYQYQVLDAARRLLVLPGGLERLRGLALRLDAAGIFLGTDWDQPAALVPAFVEKTFTDGVRESVVLEVLSELRLLAVASGAGEHPGVSAEQARHFLTQVLALNLNRLFGPPDEAARARLGPLADAVRDLLQLELEALGLDDVLASLVEEIERVLAQRPLTVTPLKSMITQVSATLLDAERGREAREAREHAEGLVAALFGPTEACREDPGLTVYSERLGAMNGDERAREARALAASMHEVGLVSDYHVGFLRWLLEQGHDELVPDALGLGDTGREAWRSHAALVRTLILEAIHPTTAQAVQGLAGLLDRGVLHAPSIAPALWRQVAVAVSDNAGAAIAAAYGPNPEPRVRLLAGVVALLGQPLGIGQGNNPTCQAARAISLWAYTAPAYLLHLLAQATRFDDILMYFEGQALRSAELPPGPAPFAPRGTDPVSVALVPHLDRVYMAMGRLCVGREEDPHRWINPELHGWWVGRGFEIAVDVASGALDDHEGFLRRFHASYHPLHRGNRPLIHPQPAGVAVTDHAARFVGWHAVTILRVERDPDGVVRVYFFNPNNDSGQDWGDGVVVSIRGHGEVPGESSLPFAQFASRLYLFHDDPLAEPGDPDVDPDELRAITDMARRSWAADRVSLPADVDGAGKGRQAPG